MQLLCFLGFKLQFDFFKIGSCLKSEFRSGISTLYTEICLYKKEKSEWSQNARNWVLGRRTEPSHAQRRPEWQLDRWCDMDCTTASQNKQHLRNCSFDIIKRLHHHNCTFICQMDEWEETITYCEVYISRLEQFTANELSVMPIPLGQWRSQGGHGCMPPPPS